MAVASWMTLAAACGQTIGQKPAAQPSPERSQSAGVPLDRLTETVRRPLFSPSRRPPAPHVDAALTQPPPPAPPPPKPAVEPPHLVLLGIIRSDATGAAAVVQDDLKHKTQSLRIGETMNGWAVQSIGASDVVLTRGAMSVTLMFPSDRARRPPPSAVAMPHPPIPGPVPPAGPVDD